MQCTKLLATLVSAALLFSAASADAGPFSSGKSWKNGQASQHSSKRSSRRAGSSRNKGPLIVDPSGQYVWTGTHWERRRAPEIQVIVVEPVVRDHRQPEPWGMSDTPIVRDHRQHGSSTSGSSGGVTVSNGRPVIRDHR